MAFVTKLLVTMWLAAAFAFELWLLQVWGLTGLAVSVFAVAFAAAWFDRRIIAAVLAFTYVFPVLLWWYASAYDGTMSVVWMVALFGAMLPDLLRTPWNVPRRWQPQLAAWALVIAATATVVVLREIDFNIALLAERGLPNTSIGGAPPSMCLFVIHTAATLLLGLLWIDWLFGARGVDLRRTVVVPLGLSCAVMAVVALIQMFHDVTFWNPTVFGATGRASGTVFDGNVCGAVAALWFGGVFWLTGRADARRPYVVGGGVVLMALTVWASGSRTALVGAVVILGVSLLGPAVFATRKPPLKVILAGVVAAVLLVGAAWAVSPKANRFGLSDSVTGPLTRMPTNVAGLRALVGDLWGRAEYGTVAVAMIREFPLSGVGVGMYPMMGADFGGSRKPDNAQNWFRHQLAEFGVVGSLGWIVWTASFAFALFAMRRGEGITTWASRGVLIGFALMSLVGMPGQDIGVAVTFWVAVFWFLSGGQPTPAARPVIGGAWWAVVLTVAIAATAVTFVEAKGPLRVAARAQRVGWPYEYGFYPPEAGASGNERWTGERAVAVVDAPKRWMAITVSVNPLALVSSSNQLTTNPIPPVDVTVRLDGAVVLRAHLVNTSPMTTTAPVADEPRTMIEVRASRTFDPVAIGAHGQGDRGALVSWEFVDRPR